MNYTEAMQLAEQVRCTLDSADRMVRATAPVMVGRLRLAGVDKYTLKHLKQELQNYDARNGKWKERT